jgi:hypothetical protein
MIEVKLVGFHVEGDKLHLTLQFPDLVKVSEVPSGVVAVQQKPKRQDILRCKDLDHVRLLIKPYPDLVEIFNREQEEMNENGERMTVKKAAALLYTVAHDKKRIRQEPKPAISFDQSQGSVDVAARYNLLKDLGYTTVNYSQKIPEWLGHKYPSMMFFCSGASDEEFASITNETDNQQKPDDH